jgi:hypothetical protein
VDGLEKLPDGARVKFEERPSRRQSREVRSGSTLRSCDFNFVLAFAIRERRHPASEVSQN